MTLALIPALIISFQSFNRDYLTDGVSEIAAPGSPGVLATFGNDAFPIVAAKYSGGQASVVAGSVLGKGRLIGFGHSGYFGAGTINSLDTGKLIVNSIHWLSRFNNSLKIATIRTPELAAFLRSKGFTVAEINAGDDPMGFNVVCFGEENFSDQYCKVIKNYVQVGGGVMAACTGWGWQQITGKSMQENSLNKIYESSGLVWTNGFGERTSSKGYDVKNIPDKFIQASVGFQALIQNDILSTKQTSQIADSILLTMSSVSESESQLVPKVKNFVASSDAMTRISNKTPIKSSDAKSRLAVALSTFQSQTQSVDKINPSPAANSFPGEIPSVAKRISKSIEINTLTPDWQSLGVYAPPGEIITISVPEAIVNKGFQIRIGCHTDSIWHLDTWARAPVISNAFEIKKAELKVANAFGGLIYLHVPRNQKLGVIKTNVSGAIESPLYVHGKTTKQQWITIRNYPGPWAELATEKIIVTVPSETIRNLDNPSELMDFWDKVMDADADLSAIPRKRLRPERIVADLQISAGYMHSGYPIMTHLDAAPLVVNLQKLQKDGSWGHFHELGHNHQVGDWTFDGTGEVTVNLFSMYVYEKVVGINKMLGHGALSNPQEVKSKLLKYLSNGAKFEQWKSDPFLALIMYIQMIDEFGWDAFKRVFAEYKNLPQSERPKNDDQKRDQWMIRFSKSVGKNLGPFFTKWGVPTSQKAKDEIANMPIWLPDDLR